ncbi:hypothetical protein [Okeania sp. SIO1I7]|nr:hypothetical protein [Okeania sp. SIO1I7]
MLDFKITLYLPFEQMILVEFTLTKLGVLSRQLKSEQKMVFESSE